MEYTFKEKMLIKLLLASNKKMINTATVEGCYQVPMILTVVSKNMIKDEKILYKLIINAYNNDDYLSKNILAILIEEHYSLPERESFEKNYFKILSSNFSIDKIIQIVCAEDELVGKLHTCTQVYTECCGIKKEDINYLTLYLIEPKQEVNMTARIFAVYILSAMGKHLKQKEDKDLLNFWQESIKKIFVNRVSTENLSEEEKTSLLNKLNQNLRMYFNGRISDGDYELILSNFLCGSGYEENLSFHKVLNDRLSHLTIEQINNINTKIINQIFEIAIKKFPTESNYASFPYNMFVNMYLAFGKQKTIDLIEGKYGEISLSMLEYMFSSIDGKKYNIPQKNGEVAYTKEQQALINFFFASGPNDVNANIKKFISGEISSSEISVSRIINEWSLHYQLLQGKVSLSALIEQLKSSLVLPPNLKEIEPVVSRAGFEYYDIIKDTYEKMQERIHSTIPKISGTVGEYEYEILNLNDVGQMLVGYQTRCCFTFGGESEISLVDGCTSKDSRIFIVRKNGELIAQSWVWRNGNVVCFDNIETVGLTRKYDKEIWGSYKEASEKIISTTAKSDEPVEMITIGVVNSKINMFGEELLPDEKLLPIKKGLYTDAYEQVMIGKSPNYQGVKSYNPKAVYQDSRKQVIVVDPQQVDPGLVMKVNFLINKIKCTLSPEGYKDCEVEEEYTYLICGQDWYIGITSDGNIECKSISYDDRSKGEIEKAMHSLKEKIKTGDLNVNLNDLVLEERGKNGRKK